MTLQKSNQVETPQLPGNFASGTMRTLLVVGMLVLVFTNWQAFIAIFVNILLWIYALLGHNANTFGWAIIIFTIVVRAVTWPLNAQQMKSAQAMQEFQNDKEWQDIQKKYAKDKEKLAQEQMRLMGERGISPFASCLPMLIQLPLWFAVIQALTRTLATTPLAMLQLARSIYTWPQTLVPGFSVSSVIPPNPIFLWVNLGIPEFTDVLGFGVPILVVLVGITSFFQIRLTTPPSANPNDQSAQMTQSMSYTMPIMMIMMASAYSSGFSLYLLTSNTLAIIQAIMQGKASWKNVFPGKAAKPSSTNNKKK